MLRRKLFLKTVILILFLIFSSSVFAQQETDQYYKTNNELRSVLQENFDAYEEEKIYKVLETVHTLSPTYLSVRQVSGQIFPVYELKYELMSFKYLLTDGAYALARAVQKTSKVKGPAFRNNVLDLIVVFRQEKGKWKLWNQVILGLEYIN